MKRELEAIFGQSYRVSPAGGAAGGGYVPYYLQRKFDLFRIEAHDTSFLLARLRNAGNETENALADAISFFERSYGMPTLLYWGAMTRAQAAGMRERGVGYLSAHAGFSIPFLWMQAPGYGMRRPRRQAASLSPCAQSLVVRQLVNRDVEGKNIRQLAKLLPYSAVLLGRAKDELLGRGFCEYPQGTRAGAFHFPRATRQLWEAASPFMSTPVRDTYRVRIEDCEGLPKAGASALAQLTSLEDNALPTYAFYARSKAARIAPAAEDKASAIVERWSYPPRAAGDGTNMADRCSLYLSLLHDLDPRVEIARSQIWNP